jgi:hypothetical protein
VPKGEEDWTEAEVALIVADYFEMLRKELLGETYSKAEHRKALHPLLPRRSKGSIEYKHQNISAVLVSLGLPYIAGYKPAKNLQGLLVQAVEAYLEKQANYLEQLASAPMLTAANAPPPPSGDVNDIVAPEQKKPWLTRKPRRIDFAERDATNRRMGKSGEEFVVEVERLRLRNRGRHDLARKVDWVTQTIGNGLGFDVLSFDENDSSERLLEVKTTGYAKSFPFYVTANEVLCSEDMAKQYYLYRVFHFSRSPRLYILRGSLRQTCKLEPVQFVATLEASGAGAFGRRGPWRFAQQFVATLEASGAGVSR